MRSFVVVRLRSLPPPNTILLRLLSRFLVCLFLVYLTNFFKLTRVYNVASQDSSDQLSANTSQFDTADDSSPMLTPASVNRDGESLTGSRLKFPDGYHYRQVSGIKRNSDNHDMVYYRCYNEGTSIPWQQRMGGRLRVDAS